MTTSINELVSNLNFRLLNLNKIRKLTNERTRLRFASSFILGKLYYLLPTVYSAPKPLIQKLHVIYLKTARYIWNGNSFKVNNKTILSNCNWPSIESLIQHATLSFIHKILFTGRPDTILSLFILPNRQAKNIVPRVKFTNKNSKNLFIYNILELYNGLKLDLKLLEPRKFKVKLRKALGYYGIPT